MRLPNTVMFFSVCRLKGEPRARRRSVPAHELHKRAYGDGASCNIVDAAANVLLELDVRDLALLVSCPSGNIFIP